MVVSIRLSEQETSLIKDYAKLYNTSVSDIIRRSILERIEDELEYPGQIRVTVVREARVTEIAK